MHPTWMPPNSEALLARSTRRCTRVPLRASVSTVLAFAAVLIGVPARAEWPQFRGPAGDGHAAAPTTGTLPLTWSEQEHVRWKTEIPHKGWSTPVSLEGKVWLTTATPDGHDFFIMALDAATGAVLLDKKLFHADNPEPLGNHVNTYASCSPAVEPGRVYVHFGSYGTACLDAADGRVLWSREDLPCRHYRGPGSSVVLFENLLLLTMDGVDQQYVCALDKTTGTTVWRTDRTTQFNDLGDDGKPVSNGDLRKGFSTPLLIEVDGQWQMISPASMCVYAYDPRTGKELWKVPHESHTSAASAVYGGADAQGLVYVATGNGDPQVWAIDPRGRGDIAATHVRWKYDERVPRMPSPLLVGPHVYIVSDDGVVQALDAANGAKVWGDRLEGHFTASPIAAGGHVYFFNEAGIGSVLEPGAAFKRLQKNTLADGLMASPAVSGGALLLRTKTHLYCIDAQAPSRPAPLGPAPASPEAAADAQ